MYWFDCVCTCLYCALFSAEVLALLHICHILAAAAPTGAPWPVVYPASGICCGVLWSAATSVTVLRFITRFCSSAVLMSSAAVSAAQQAVGQAIVVVFARLPVPGKVKTRLAAGAGPEQAAAFYKLCAEHACLEVVRCPHADGVVFCAAAEDVQGVGEWLQQAGAALPVRPQIQDYDLGKRMIAALTAAVTGPEPAGPQQGPAAAAAAAGAGTAGDELQQQRYAATIVIGTDIPDLSSRVICAAVQTLVSQGGATGDAADVVLGPAADGGYYLIGFRTEALMLPDVQSCKVFEGVEWSTSSVLQTTAAAAEKLGLKVAADKLPVLQDIDTLQDAATWLTAQQQLSACLSQPGGLQISKQQKLLQQMRELLQACCRARAA